MHTAQIFVEDKFKFLQICTFLIKIRNIETMRPKLLNVVSCQQQSSELRNFVIKMSGAVVSCSVQHHHFGGESSMRKLRRVADKYDILALVSSQVTWPWWERSSAPEETATNHTSNTTNLDLVGFWLAKQRRMMECFFMPFLFCKEQCALISSLQTESATHEPPAHAASHLFLQVHAHGGVRERLTKKVSFSLDESTINQSTVYSVSQVTTPQHTPSSATPTVPSQVRDVHQSCDSRQEYAHVTTL